MRARCGRPASRPARVTNRKKLAKRSVGAQAAAQPDIVPTETEEERKQRFKGKFSSRRELEGVAAAVCNLPTPILYGLSAVAAAAGAFAGYTAVGKAPAQYAQPAAVAGAVVGAGVVALGAKNAVAARDQGAAVELWNAIVDSDDPTTVQPEVMQALNSKYGQQMSAPRLEEVQRVYSAYLETIIPQGDTPLRGDEADKLRAFISAVGLQDPDAAACHIDVGRTFFRQRLEVSNRDAQVSEVRVFQKLVYVSSVLFGEQGSAFMTPWVARFKNVTPEQVLIAKREGARSIMRGRVMGEFNGVIPADAAALARLREIQLQVKLPDDACAALIQEFVAAETDKKLRGAVAVMKTRGANVSYAPAVDALDDLLVLSQRYDVLASADPGGELRMGVPGIGPITTVGTSYALVNKNELLDLFKLYAETKIEEAGDALSPDTNARLDALVVMLGLVPQRAEDVRISIITEAYKRLLVEAVTSKELDQGSPAQVLNRMINQVSMPGAAAAALHESLYREKLESVLEDKCITDEEEAAVQRTARLLCVPAAKVEEIDAEIKGRLLRNVLTDIMEVGVDAFGEFQRDAVLTAKKNLRMSDEAAFKVLQELGRRQLVKMINGARNKGSKLDNARELKRVVYFSNIVLAPLVEILKGGPPPEKGDAMKELAATLAKAREDAEKEEAEVAEGATAEANEEGTAQGGVAVAEDSEAGEPEASTSEAAPEGSETVPTSLAKAEKAASAREAGETVTDEGGKEIKMSSQKDITVEADFERQDRIETYKTYLMFCMTGDVVQLPMGGTIVMERDETEFARLSQLGDILGLSQMDVYVVHSDMAEQAFKSQAETLATGGNVNKETMDKLDEMAKSMGVAPEKAKKIVRGITNKRMMGSMANLRAQGDLSLAKVLELKELDIDVVSVVGESALMQLYRKELEQQVASGKGDIDMDRLFKSLPEDLGISAEKAKKAGAELAKDKMRVTMVQAMAYYRQHNHDDALKYLNNLIACHRMSDGNLKGAAKWGSSEEVLDVFGMFCGNTPSDALQQEMAAALELDPTAAQQVREAVKAGTFSKAAASKAASTSRKTTIF